MTKQQLEQQFNNQTQKAVNILKKSYHPDKIILYGSVARGDFTEDSDIDLLIIKKGVDKIEPHLPIYQALTLLDNIYRVEPRVYSPEEIKRTPKNNFYLQTALKEGKTLYENR